MQGVLLQIFTQFTEEFTGLHSQTRRECKTWRLSAVNLTSSETASEGKLTYNWITNLGNSYSAIFSSLNIGYCYRLKHVKEEGVISSSNCSANRTATYLYFVLAHYGYRADGVFYFSKRTMQLSSKKFSSTDRPVQPAVKQNISRYQFSKITGNCTFQRRK